MLCLKHSGLPNDDTTVIYNLYLFIICGKPPRHKCLGPSANLFILLWIMSHTAIFHKKAGIVVNEKHVY